MENTNSVVGSFLAKGEKMRKDLQKSIEQEGAELKSNKCCQAIPPEIEKKIEIHEEICDYLKNLYATKNADYGDSMHPLFEEYGLTAFLILFEIKMNRIKSLQYKGKGHYESLEDSLLDLANYAMIAVTELRSAKDKSLDKNLKL